MASVHHLRASGQLQQLLVLSHVVRLKKKRVGADHTDLKYLEFRGEIQEYCMQGHGSGGL